MQKIEDVPMASRSDKVEKGVDSVIPESWVSFDSRLFGENIVILSFQITSNFGKTCLIINLITESRCINHSQCNTSSLLLKI
jgi:hypothetical protein